MTDETRVEETIKGPEIVNSSESLKLRIEAVKAAQRIFATFTQEQVNRIFLAAATAASRERISLAKLAVEETKMGVVEDKVIKNHFASECIYNTYKGTQTCGVLEEDSAFGFKRIIEPVGVIGAVIPTTNPTSTAIFKALISLKTRNGIIFCPHPGAARCTIAAAKIILDAAVAAGAPEEIISWIDEPSIEMTVEVMKQADMVLATGGAAMVKSAYSSGNPAVGAGNGNTPALVDETADILMSVNSVIHSKTFDNGTICASEQSIIVVDKIYNQCKREFENRGCYILNETEKDLVRKIILNAAGNTNAQIVGRSAYQVAKLAGFECPKNAKILIGEVSELDSTIEPFAHEKLSTILAMYKAETFEDGVEISDWLVKDGGIGHTAVLYIDPVKAPGRLKLFENTMKTCRILINTPSSHGGIGDIYNFRLLPSLTLGCGSWAGNSVSENVGVKELMNIKTVAERRENMLWLRLPEKIYFKKGCTPMALEELRDVYYKKRAFIVTDTFLYKNGYTKPITNQLDRMDIAYHIYFDVSPDPTLSCAKAGAASLAAFMPDVIIAVGGGSAMDAAKIMWIMYEHPEADFTDLTMRFMDIRKRVYTFPKMGVKANLVCIATSSGTGSEVTPFAIITDEKTKTKYSIADYALLPTMAISDADMMMDQPRSLTASSGIDALTHALEAYASMMASDYTDGLALKAVKLVFEFLPRAYKYGRDDAEARERMANASTIAGMAFANAFLGVCHSMAHKLGSHFHVQHGVANALLITEVMKFNAAEDPVKMGTFPQYQYPHTLRRYAEIASFLNLPGNNDREKFDSLIAKIEELKALIGIVKSIAEYGIDEKSYLDKLELMCEEAFDDQCTNSNPRYPLMREIREMYLAAYYGKK